MLTWSNQHNVISVVDQCDYLWKRQHIKISSHEVIIQAYRLSMLCCQTVKVYGLANRKQIDSGGLYGQLSRKKREINRGISDAMMGS